MKVSELNFLYKKHMIFAQFQIAIVISGLKTKNNWIFFHNIFGEKTWRHQHNLCTYLLLTNIFVHVHRLLTQEHTSVMISTGAYFQPLSTEYIYEASIPLNFNFPLTKFKKCPVHTPNCLEATHDQVCQAGNAITGASK